jgi:hypothetical protein
MVVMTWRGAITHSRLRYHRITPQRAQHQPLNQIIEPPLTGGN